MLLSPDELLMERAFDLARLGLGDVSPNPCVGCVIVSNGEIIGEGWHRKYGEAHAEVNAVESVSDRMRLKGATVYVNLEPCSHTGKTPPCADMLVTNQVGKVMIANVDSNPLVHGKGVLKLRDSGIDVVVGVLEQEGRWVNRRFFTFVERKRPYIILKWAQTADGFIARNEGDPVWISNEYSRQIVHQWRSQEDAVLVGAGTAARDNPKLTVRDWSGRNPVRIVIDRYLRLPRSLYLFDGSQKTICYNVRKNEALENLAFVQVSEGDFFNQLLSDLFSRGIQSLIVEGGRQVLDLFIQSDKWDEARIFRSDSSFGAGVDAPRLSGKIIAREMIFGDELEIIRHS